MSILPPLTTFLAASSALPIPPPTSAPIIAPTTAPSATESLLPALGFLAFGVGGAAIAKVFRKRSIEGPIRVDAQTSPIPILLITLIGGAIWLGSQMLYGAAKAAEFQHAHPGESFSLDQLSDSDFAFLSTVPAAIGLGILLIGDFAAALPAKIGDTLRQIPGGILRGIVAAIIALPIVWGFTVVLSAFYEVTKIQHPSEHELLKVMKESPSHVRAVLVIGACVAAPVFEEMLFRGHIQTLLVRLLMPAVRAPLAVPMGLIVDGVGGSNPLPMPPLEHEYSAMSYLPRAGRWIAVLITSFLFAIVHPLWMAPAIFVLSVCLGYAYERTGNLWVPILIHAAFNTSSTLVFLHPQ
jgi:membrane protease YdiL (CAAX protease family)